MQALLSNKYVLYGGAALAALGVVWFLSSSGTPAAEDDGAGFFPSLVPTSAGPISFGSGAGAGTGEGANLGALIGLESKKADIGERISLAEIDAALRTNLAINETNRTLGLAQTDSLNLMSFADMYGAASKLLSVDTITGVGANFSYGGKTFSFDAARFQSGYPTHNANTLAALSGYNALPRGSSNVGSSAPVSGGAGQLSLTSAPTSRSGGQPASGLTPVAPVMGRATARVTPVATVTAPGAPRLSRADRERL